jgi:two-component system response regulator AgrA
MNIVICEDNDTFRHTIEKITSEYTARTKSNSVCTLSTADGEKVLEYIRKNSELTIYFLDIQLNGSDITGFDIAKEIRKNDWNSSIVFITSFKEKITLTYEYKLELLDYIIKSEPDKLRDKVCECMRIAESRQNIGYDGALTVLSKRFNTTIPFNDIYMIEALKGSHKLLLHHSTGLFEFYSSISSIMEQLDKRFLRCHKSVIINTDKIRAVDKKEHIIYLTNGCECEYAPKSKECREYGF